MQKNKKLMYVSLILVITLIFICLSNIDGFWEGKQEKSTKSIEEAVKKMAL